jgi:DNA polymerase-3 subunit beta
MPGEAADAFGELEPMPEGAIGLPAEILVQLLARVGFAVGKTSGAFQLRAALVRSASDTLVCAATDGSRLALAQAALTAAEPYEFLFPSEAMACVKRLVEGQEHARVAVGAQHLFVAAGARRLSARQLAGRFPDYQRVLPRFDRPPTEIDSSALRSAMTRVLLFTGSGTRVDPKMHFLLRAGELSVSAMSDRAGEGEHTLTCDYSGPEIAVGFNPRYILEFLDVAPKGTLHVWIKDDHTPTEWRPGSDDTYRYIVGPLKV